MLLAVDIGNSNIKYGVFDGEHLLSKFSVPTDSKITRDNLKSLIGDEHAITSAVICSVVPEKDQVLKDALRHAFGIETMTVSNGLDFGLKTNYQPLSALGTDRLVNSFAAVEKYGAPCIICSIGTATTFDVVNRERELLGGIIAPGMKTMAKALHLNTAKLPEIEIEKPESILGLTTVDSIRSGIFFGHVAMIDGLIQKLRKEVGDEPQVIATGGFASLIAKNATLIDIVNDDLLLDGLRILHNRLQPE